MAWKWQKYQECIYLDARFSRLYHKCSCVPLSSYNASRTRVWRYDPSSPNPPNFGNKKPGVGPSLTEPKIVLSRQTIQEELHAFELAHPLLSACSPSRSAALLDLEQVQRQLSCVGVGVFCCKHGIPNSKLIAWQPNRFIRNPQEGNNWERSDEQVGDE